MKVIISIYIFISIAFSCDETNLFKSNKGFSSIPVADQDSIGACYAYVATQIFDTERFDNGVSYSNRTHPLWTAYKYKMSLWKKSIDLDGGKVFDAIKAVAGSELCLESTAKKLILKYKKTNKVSDAEFMDTIEKIYRLESLNRVDQAHYSIVDKKEILMCSKQVNTTEGKKMVNALEADFSIISDRILPRVIIGEILKECSSDHVAKVDIKKLSDDNCSQCNDKEMQAYVLKQLKRNKPVAIAYCSEILNDQSFDGIRDDNPYIPFENRTFKTGSCAGHASILAGSREKAGKCEFLLKNSWGDWKSSAWKDCLCETSKGKYEKCTKGDKKINSVGCWIDAKSLSKNIYGTSHF